MTSFSSAEKRVHHPTNRKLLLGLGTILSLTAANVLVTSLTSPLLRGNIWQLLSFLIPLVPAIYCFAAGLSGKIETSPDGIDFYQLGLHVFATWESIEQIGPPIAGPAIMKVLRLRMPTHIKWVWISAGYRERIIQLPLMSYNLKPESPLYQDFEHYIPHLLSDN